MRRVTLRSLWAHKRRLLSTVLAVVLGVSFMSGTFILSTTLDQSFDDLFANLIDDVDAVVQGQVLFSNQLTGDQRANLPEDLPAQVAEAPGVAAAFPHVSTSGVVSINRVVGSDGEPIGGAQSRTVFDNWIDDELSPFRISDGRQPEADDEMVLNVAAAEEGDLDVGDDVTVITQEGEEHFELVGTFSFGAAKSAGGGVNAGFTLPRAQQLAGLTGEISSVYVRGEDGRSPEQLVTSIDRAVGGPSEVVTGEQAIAQLSKDTQTEGGFGFITIALTVFGVIALLVGVFVISNTFSILVAQRTKELALLRALGASRAQVLSSVLLEAGVVGAVAAVLGVLGGLGMANAITGIMSRLGAQLPSVNLVVEIDTIVLSLLIGILITLLASLLPAIRATRVPPLAALRDVAIDRSNLSRVRLASGVLLLVVGAVNLSTAWRANGDTNALPQVGVGALLMVVGFLVVGPVMAGPTVRILGLPLPRLRGVTGKLATENAARSPKRTSATASAVVIGVALVVFIQIFSASAATSVRSEVGRNFAADFVISTESTGLVFMSGLPNGVAERAREVPGVETVAALGFGSIGLQYPDGETASHFASTIDPKAVKAVFNPKLVEGDLDDLGDDGIIVDKFVAEDHDIQLLDPIIVIAPGGKTLELRVEGLSDDRNLLNMIAMTRTAYTSLSSESVDIRVAVKVAEGEDVDQVIAATQEAMSDFPAVEVEDREAFIGSLIKQITSYITMINGLLVLSIITALVGIANTLSLSIGERTRELGLLRAVGMDRTDVRSTVRWEAALIASLGAVVGVSMGVMLSLALLQAMSGYGLAKVALPGGRLGIVLVLTACLGTLAAVRPARRAAGLPILDAISSE